MRLASSLVVLGLALSGCGLGSFDIPVEEGTTIPGNSVNPAPWVSEDLELPEELTSFSLSDRKEFKEQGVKPSDVSSIKLTSLKLWTDQDDLDFIDRIELYVVADGLPKVLIAHGTIPRGKSQVRLETTRVELKEYATARVMGLLASADGSQPDRDTKFVVRANFRVEVF
ncbi:hypothetical protein [Vulgatibacter incomptus]|uniref:Lipoprotein n=1 Tax=Vulgatibacter incomptus TaxID=1391653 RepID=A0A0K1PA42_9BACT|nr:hypothetical protein [Vulgatibacter incomptus]AKU90281.1 hypothetical protein AKJ08_0668 [Vulgatibacter incomptus]